MSKFKMAALSIGILIALASVTGCEGGSSKTSSTSSNAAKNSASGSTSSGATITMRIGDTSSATSIPGQAVQKFADLVEKYSKGHIKAQVFSNGQLGPFDQEATELKTNSINAMFIQPDALGTHVKLAQVDAWPFMFHTPEEMVKAWTGPGGQKVIKEIEKSSGYLLAAPTWNSPRYIFLNKPVSNLAEAKGMKVRVPGEDVYLNQMKLLGLSAVGMNIADVYTGMQSNIVNGMEATLVDASNYKLQEVAKTIITDGHVIAPKMFLFWGAWIDGLNQTDRDVVMKAATDAAAFYSQQAKSQNAQLEQLFKDKGVKFVDPGMTFDHMKQLEDPLAQQIPDVYKWAQQLEQGAQ